MTRHHVLSSTIRTLLVGAALAALTYATWGEVLDYYYPSEDAFGFLPYVKAERFSDVLDIFLRETTQGKLEGVIATYRPISNVTFALEYLLHGLDSRAFHVTDLVLHWLCAWALYLFVVQSGIGSVWAATAAAALFCIHPLHIETVPVSTRRCELVMGLFMLLTLILFARHLVSNRVGGAGRCSLPLCVSFASAGLAFGSKETAVTLIGLIFVCAFLFAAPRETSFLRQTRRALLYSLPYLGMAVAFFAIRWHIIGGIGGHFYQMHMALPRRVVMAAVVLAYTSVRMAIPFLPLMPSPFEYAARHLPYTLSMAALAAASVLFWLWPRWRWVGQAVCDPRWLWAGKRATGYAAVVAALVVVISPYVVLGGISPWYAYVPTLFLSTLCALVARDAARFLLRRPWARTPGRVGGVFYSVLSILAVGYFMVLVVFSPLFTRSYRDWETASNINREILEKTEAVVSGFPEGSLFYTLNYPIILGTHVTHWNHVLAVSLLYDYTLDGYFAEKYPDKRFRFIGLSYTSLGGMPESLRVSTEFFETPSIRVTVHKGGILDLPRFHVDERSRDRVSGKWFDIVVEKEDTNLPAMVKPFTQIRIDMKPRGLERDNVYFLVYDGQSVTLYDPVSLGWRTKDLQ